jgi:Transglycosylase SLT domain
LASKDSKARHRREGKRVVTFAWRADEHPRHRLRQPSTGLLAVSAVVLAASAASSPVQADPATPPRPDPEPVASADGGTTPSVDFPTIQSHLASGRFVGTSMPVGGGTGAIPATVLAAYQRAVERTNLVQPNCHIPLELLAAIGKVESGHARGGRVDDTGRTLTPILGPVLDGGAFAAIADTDGGAFDGDTVWDRAIGPMQFIPGTWESWASDGNVDGRQDPHNVYDASLAAARYLCAANRDLGTPAGLDAAILSYNHSTSYLSLVRSWMSIYRDGTISVDDIVYPGIEPAIDLEPTAPPSTPVAPVAPVTPPPVPPVPPPSSPPPTTPPPTTTPPVDPPPTDPTTEPTTEPTDPATEPTDPPPSTEPAPGETTEESPADQPADQEDCGLADVVGGLVDGLLGESQDCVMDLELSTPELAP